MTKRRNAGRPGSQSSRAAKPVSQPDSSGHSSPRTSPQISADTSGPRKASKLAPGLYAVATPIGNLGDITLRALDTLRDAELILCEDTRITGRLLARYGIATPTRAYYEHNAARVRPGLLARLERGAAIALVSDAGTPLVSDPGYRLVQEALERGIAVVPIPGASAVMAALCLAGLPTDRFLFAGFPANRQAARRRDFEALRAVPATLVFFESARRLAASLADMAGVFGPRPAAVTRELTKRFEESRRGTLDRLAEDYGSMPPPRGEVTIVVAPPGGEAGEEPDLDRLLGAAMAEHSLKDAVDRVAAASGLPRRVVYARALALRDAEAETGP